MLLLAISILSCPGEDGPFRKCVRAVAEDRRDVRLLYRDSSDGPYICCLPIFAAGRSESDMRCGTVWPSVGGFWCGIEYVDVSGKSTFQWNGPFFRFLLRLISLWLFHFNARHILISSYFILHLDRSIWFNWGKNDWSDIIKCSISSLFFFFEFVILLSWQVFICGIRILLRHSWYSIYYFSIFWFNVVRCVGSKYTWITWEALM